MKMTRRFCALALLALLAAGCSRQAVSLGAPAVSQGETAVSEGSEGGEAPAATAPVTGSPDTVASNRGGVIEPPLDGERLGEGLFHYAAYLGPDFSRHVEEGTGYVFDRRGELPLRVLKETTDLETFSVSRTEAPAGMQVRLVHQFTDASGTVRYQSCDALTTSPGPDGRNLLFSGLNVGRAGRLHLFYLKPDPAVTVPTADFSAACVDLGSGPDGPFVTREGFLTSSSRYEVLGSVDVLWDLFRRPGLSPEVFFDVDLQAR